MNSLVMYESDTVSTVERALKGMNKRKESTVFEQEQLRQKAEPDRAMLHEIMKQEHHKRLNALNALR